MYEKYDSEWDGDIKSWTKKGYPTSIYDTKKAKDI